MTELIEARLQRLRQIAQGLEPDPLPEQQIEQVFLTELDTELAQELNLVEDIWGLTHYR